LNAKNKLKYRSLFLDRDGVINRKLQGDYVKVWDEFIFCVNALEAIAELSKAYDKIFIVTNQRGVGKGVMSEVDLIEIHRNMVSKIKNASGRIDKIYYCTDIHEGSQNRKPNIGMALQAKQDFPEIEFSDSVMVGDSISDMEFASKLGMKRVFISIKNLNELDIHEKKFDLKFDSLFTFAENVKNGILD
jgi:D-glycero-D-manno-heptose 1,7-bisphosphate phosphatase